MNARLENTLPDTLDAEQAIGQIAVQLPGATAVFRRLKLDFCCRERQGPEPARPARRAGCPAAPQHPARRH